MIRYANESEDSMKIVTWTVGIIAMFGLAACAEPGHYPVSDEECGPNDPVLTLDASDCAPIPSGL